jgi:HlyD family secretion protein
VPLGALFRDGSDWAVFKVEDGDARLTRVKIGRNGAFDAEVLEGLKAGDAVILHPSDRIHDGVGVERRNSR